MNKKSVKAIKLDLKDEKLLSLLRADSRMPISDLAKQLVLNRDTVKYRMERLQKQKVITKYYAEIDRSLFGYVVCDVFMLLNETNRRRQKQLMAELINHPNTESIVEYNDKWDIKWTLVVKHLEDLDEILMQLSSRYARVIIEKDTLLIVRWSRAELTTVADGKALIDLKDVRILSMLSENARASAVDIGQKVELSADAVIKRIKALVDNQVIRRFTVNLDPKAMNKQWYTVVIQMRHFDEKHQARLKEYVRVHPNIVRCFKTIGTYDIILRLVISDISEFHTTFKELKTMFSDIIRNYDAFVGYKQHFISSLPRVITEAAGIKEERKVRRR